jgi:hypothetical protein
MKYNLTRHLHHKDVKSFDVMGYDYHILKKLKKLGFDVILYIKAIVSVYVGSAWKILPVTAHSLWSVLGVGEGRAR